MNAPPLHAGGTFAFVQLAQALSFADACDPSAPSRTH
jgi:hypothetical protein